MGFDSTFRTFAFCETGIAQKTYVKVVFQSWNNYQSFFQNGQNIYRSLCVERKHISPQGRTNKNTVAYRYLIQTRQKR